MMSCHLVAVPTLREHLAASTSGLLWIVDAYTLAFAALLLSTGLLSDRWGTRRAFQAGLIVFVVASVGCGLAPTVGWLIATRVVQGVGAALLAPTSLALIHPTPPTTAWASPPDSSMPAGSSAACWASHCWARSQPTTCRTEFRSQKSSPR